MKKLFLIAVFALPLTLYGQLQLPYSVKVVNPLPLDKYYYNNAGAPYTNTSQVTSQILSAVRYQGMTVNVAGVEYWFKDGIADIDLVAKAETGSSTFEDLTDGPGSYSGKGLNYIRVKTSEDGLEYATPTEVVTSLPNAAADDTNKGVATFEADDFNSSSGLISLDRTNIAARYPSTRTVTSSTTLLLTDAGNAVEMNSASSTTITVPPQADVTWVADTYITLIQKSTGAFTVTEGSGVTFINYSGSTVSGGEGAFIVLKRTSTADEWYVLNGSPPLTFQSLIDGGGPFSGNGQNYVRVAAGETTLQYRTPTQVVSDLPNAAADGTTKGVSTFTANDFNSSSGNISIDYTNGQAASGSNKGFLTSADWTTFNNKQAALTLGTGVQTWLATPSWTNFNSAITGTSPFWNTSGTTTLVGNTTIIGTGFSMKHQHASLGAVKTIGYGMYLQNPTAAALAAQQWSPVLTLEGQAWLTTSSTSVDVGYSAYVIPVQGAGTAGGTFVLEPTVNGTTLTTGYLKMSTVGASLDVTANGIQIRSSVGGVGGLSFNGSTPVSGKIFMTPGSFSIETASNWSSGGKGVVISAGAAINATSGTQNAISLEGNFIPTSGSANFRALSLSNTINQTGGSSGVVSFIGITPTYTSAPDVIVYDYAPVSGSPTSHLVWRNVSGNLLFGGSTITASTRVDQRGLGTTSSTINHRWANSSNTVLAQLTDDGALALNSKIVGRAVLVGGTVTVNTTAVQSGDEIFLTNRITGGTPGLLSVGTVTAGTSFVINSASGTDTSTISWMIIKATP